MTEELAPENTLGLRVERDRTVLRLIWNRESPAILGALSGTLLIRAGKQQRTVRLTPDQLQAGSILYVPTADRIDFQLLIVARDYQIIQDYVPVLL